MGRTILTGFMLSLFSVGLCPCQSSASVQVVNDDVSVWSGFPNNRENGGVLYVGNNAPNPGDGTSRTYLKFNLPAFVPGTQIIAATLSGQYATDFIAADDGLFNWHVAASDAWTESTITWNTQPGPLGGPIASWNSAGAIPNSNYGWNITSAVNQAYQGDGVLSLVFKSAVEGVGQNWEYWWGSEQGLYPFQIDFHIEAIPGAPGAVPEPGQLVVWSILGAMSVGGVYLRRRG